MPAERPDYTIWSESMRTLANQIGLFPNLLKIHQHGPIFELAQKIRDEAQLFRDDLQHLVRLLRPDIERKVEPVVLDLQGVTGTDSVTCYG
ncbi:hypothetical protein C7212DRAFT_315151 [Tuber magnatum]|uniref:Uncharacterized protein n=1 Tax=Tuber magnatum TaxID=42249 RepID=A0A317SRU0_9PEZI|nr:hypothetical protein C7212DRAFT_315151 [Tuber magnatum]